MSDVSQNPNFHLSKPPHKLSNKHVLLKNKPTKKSSSTTKSRNKNNNQTMLNNTNNNNNSNRPLKVVHISNPMKFQVAAAGFRALVQGLTGRDAVLEWPIDHQHETGQVVVPAACTDDDSTGGNNSTDDQSSPQNDDDHHQQQHNFSSSSVCFEPSDHHRDDHHLMMSFDDYFGAHNNFNNGDVTVPENDDDIQLQQLYGCCYGEGLSSPSFYGQSLLH